MSQDNIIQQVVPAIDMQKIQDAANAAAMKGVISCIEDYYTGYSSPYKKAVTAHLEKSSVDHALSLPDIVAVLNESLSAEIDKIANTAIAQTFLPMVGKILTREEKYINFSDILKMSIKDVYNATYQNCECTVEKHSQYDWYNVVINNSEKTYELTLHEVYQSKKNGAVKYEFLGLPYFTAKNSREEMTVNFEGGSIKMPFTRTILQDPFISYAARLVLSGSEITMDIEEFEEDMFTEKCHC